MYPTLATSFFPLRGRIRPTTYLPMNAETIVKLIEELVDLKVQHEAASHLKLNPEVSKLLAQKRETDRRRLEHVRAELVRLLNG
jgi:hypothetical protein